MQQDAFGKLENFICSEPILQCSNFLEPFILTTDVNNYTIGKIISQGKVPHEIPIAYARRTLNKAESNYSTTRKELSLVGVLNIFDHIYMDVLSLFIQIINP